MYFNKLYALNELNIPIIPYIVIYRALAGYF